MIRLFIGKPEMTMGLRYIFPAWDKKDMKHAFVTAHPRSCLENPSRADGMVRAELVTLETGAAEVAVQREHIPVYFCKYSHRTHIDADITFPAPVRIDIHFKQYG